jgi:hypothetical protein
MADIGAEVLKRQFPQFSIGKMKSRLPSRIRWQVFSASSSKQAVLMGFSGAGLVVFLRKKPGERAAG